MYGNYFNNKFNDNNEEEYCTCPDCLEENDGVESMGAEIEIRDPEEVIVGHFEMVLQADNEEEIYALLTNLFNAGVIHGQQQELLSDVQMKIDMLNELNEMERGGR